MESFLSTLRNMSVIFLSLNPEALLRPLIIRLAMHCAMPTSHYELSGRARVLSSSGVPDRQTVPPPMARGIAGPKGYRQVSIRLVLLKQPDIKQFVGSELKTTLSPLG